MTFIVSAGVLFLLHNIPVSVVISGYIQDRKLLFYGVCRKLLDCQPVQTLFPLFARDFLSLGLPPPRDEAQIVQAVVHGHRVQVHHLKARNNPSPVPLPAGDKTNLKVSDDQE